MIFEIGDILVTSDLFTEKFCCDLPLCKGQCCVEGEAGAPVKMEELAPLEEAAELIFDDLSPEAQAVIRRQGVVYSDQDGELVTSIINGRDCVFCGYKEGGNGKEGGEAFSYHFCALERAFSEGRTSFQKPISCALYPLREKRLKNGMIGLSYNKWNICAPAKEKGERLSIPLYKFLRPALVRRFGEAWVAELEELATHLY